MRRPRPTDVVLYLCGLLPLAFTALDYYRRTAVATIPGRGVVHNGYVIDGYHGVFGWLGAAVGLVAALLVVACQIGPLRDLSPRSAAAALFGLATLCVLAASFVQPDAVRITTAVQQLVEFSDGTLVVHYSRGPGFWLSLSSLVLGLLVAGLQLRPPAAATDVGASADSGPDDAASVEVGSVGSADAGSGSVEAGSADAEVGSVEAGSAQAGSAYAGSAEAQSAEAGSAEAVHAVPSDPVAPGAAPSDVVSPPDRNAVSEG